MPSDAIPVANAQQCLDQAIDTLLRNTHRAWRTLKIPKVSFPEDRALSVDDFIGRYRSKKLLNLLLTTFCTQFGPVLDGEFFFSYYLNRDGILGGQKLFFFLTSERLVIWDTARRSYWVVPLDSCASFSKRKAGYFLIETKNGNTSEVCLWNCPFEPNRSTITLINAAITWANTPHDEPAAPAPERDQAAAKSSGVKVKDISLRKVYALRGATAATSISTIFWIIAIFGASGTIFIPGFLGILLIGLIGYIGGYAYGALVQMRVRGYKKKTTRS
ncbi:MAG: hypothetical protein P4K93_12365 [Terracidiphilus sp.]|nr:hypothetical protein [Terracidiphilus sp.]MDR3798945.1 hypothetical protein [Terracidiphilus sp.]